MSVEHEIRRWHAAYPPGVPPAIELDGRSTLVSLFEKSCRRFADRPSYHNLGVTLSFGELDRQSRCFAAYLSSRGLTSGDRIALMMPNVLQYPIALFGALRAGLVVVNTNPLYTPRELRHQLMDSGARAIVVLENFARTVAEVRPDVRIEHVVTASLGDLSTLPRRAAINFVARHVKHLVPRYELRGSMPFREALAIGKHLPVTARRAMPEDVAFLQYTGGTTGVAKGAVLTHRNLVANVLQLAAFWRGLIEPGREVMIAPLPLYHVFSLTANALLFMHLGGLNVLITNPRDLRSFIGELRRWRFSMMTGVDTLYSALLDRPEISTLDFSHLKLAAAGGMALRPGVAERWRALTGRPLIEGYGLTEASPVVACNPNENPHPGTVGIPLPSTDIRILDGEMDVPDGEPGELCVRGPQVMAGYWNRPEETARTLSGDGWLRTGDIALIEPDGFVRIVDRKKDVIIISGFKVFPNEVESVVGEHPAVLESGCIGVPDPRSGQAVKVFVALRAGMSLSSEELREFCRLHLTGYKVPRYIEFRASLPKSHVGKVLRRELAREEQASRAA